MDNKALPNNADSEGLSDAEEDGLSLEELSQTYAQVLQRNNGIESANTEQAASTDFIDPQNLAEMLTEHSAEHDACPVTPASIVEAILFVGQSGGRDATAAEMASAMRGVEVEEIETLVQQLNEVYESQGSGLRIVSHGAGYRMQLSDEVESIKDRFYGPARQVKLNQAAIDCLALVAYQPGISREQLEEQRGQASGAILNQLVRRQLIEIKRGGPKNREVHYFPTDKLVQLIGLDSINDLPQVEDD